MKGCINQQQRAIDIATKAETKQLSYFQNFLSLLYLNLVLLLLMSFSSAGKNILVDIFQKGGYTFLGPTQFICNYFFGPLTLLFVDTLIEKFRFSHLFYISSFNVNLFLIGGLLVTSCQYEDNSSDFICQRGFVITISILCSILAGILQTVYYVSYTTYINSVSNDYNKSFYYGLSYSINSASSIFSNILGYYLLEYMGNYEFYVIIVISTLAIQLLLFFVVDVRTRFPYVPISSFKANMIYQFGSIKNQIFDYKFSKLFIFLCFAGFMNSVIYLYQPVMTTNSLKDTANSEQYLFIVFLFSGIGQIIGGTIGGKLCEYIYRVNVAYIAVSVVFVGNTLALLSFLDSNFILACVGGFFFGLADTSCCSLGLTIITKEISRSNHVFASFSLCQSIGFGVPSIFWLIFSERIFYWDLSFVFIMSTIALLSLLYYKQRCSQLMLNLDHESEKSFLLENNDLTNDPIKH